MCVCEPDEHLDACSWLCAAAMRQPLLHPPIFQDRVLAARPNGNVGVDLRCRALAAASVFLLSRCSVNTSIVRAVVVHETRMDVGGLDRRLGAALQLFERQDPTSGEAELRAMAEQYPSYAPPSFYLGLLSQRRQETEMAVGFYAAALHAGIHRVTYIFCSLQQYPRPPPMIRFRAGGRHCLN